MVLPYVKWTYTAAAKKFFPFAILPHCKKIYLSLLYWLRANTLNVFVCLSSVCLLCVWYQYLLNKSFQNEAFSIYYFKKWKCVVENNNILYQFWFGTLFGFKVVWFWRLNWNKACVVSTKVFKKYVNFLLWPD